MKIINEINKKIHVSKEIFKQSEFLDFFAIIEAENK